MSGMTYVTDKLEMTQSASSANQSEYYFTWYMNGTNRLSLFGYSMQFFVYRLGHCVKLQEDPTPFLRNIALVQLAISVLGFLGAAATVTVTSSRRMRSSTSVFLMALGIYDAVFTLASLVLASLRLAGAYVMWLTSLCNCVWTFCVFSSAYVIICVTAERCLSVAKPYCVEKYRTTSLAVKLNAGILIAGALVNIPQILDEVLELSSEGSCRAGQKRFRLTKFGLIYTLFISSPINFVIPFFIVLIMNSWFACTLLVMKRSRRKQSTVSHGSSRKSSQPTSHDEGLIHLIVGLSAWYTVCWLLPGFYYVYKLPKANIFNLTEEIKIAACVDTLIVANAAINSVFYFLLWRQFRLACVASCRYHLSSLHHHDSVSVPVRWEELPLEPSSSHEPTSHASGLSGKRDLT